MGGAPGAAEGLTRVLTPTRLCRGALAPRVNAARALPPSRGQAVDEAFHQGCVGGTEEETDPFTQTLHRRQNF